MIDYLEIKAGQEVTVEDLATASGLTKEQVQNRMLRLVRRGQYPIEAKKPGRVWVHFKAKGRGGPRRPQPEVLVEKALDKAMGPSGEGTLVKSVLEQWPTGDNDKVSDHVVNAFVQPSWIMRLDSVESGLRVAYTVMGHDSFMKRLAHILVVNEVPDFDGKAR
jgi:hypothetical protein